MNEADQFLKAKIIPAQSGWYACDPISSDDGKKCVGIDYVPVIAWAITESEEMSPSGVKGAITLPIFTDGGSDHALSSMVAEHECCQLFYKAPNGRFSRFAEWYEAAPEAEGKVIEAYTADLQHLERKAAAHG